MVKLLPTFTELLQKNIAGHLHLSIFKMILNLKFLTISWVLGSRLKYLRRRYMYFKTSHVQNTFVITKHHEVSEELLTAELVKWLP